MRKPSRASLKGGMKSFRLAGCSQVITATIRVGRRSDLPFVRPHSFLLAAENERRILGMAALAAAVERYPPRIAGSSDSAENCTS